MREVLLLCWRDFSHPQGGGSERYLEQVGAHFAAQGIAVTYRTARYPGAPKDELKNGIKFLRGGGRFTVYPRTLGALLAARCGVGPLRGIKPDVIIDTQNGIPFFAALVSSVPTVVLVHHCHREQWPVAGSVIGKIGWFIESWLSPRVHRRNQYVTVSIPSAEELVELSVREHSIAVVRAGIELPVFPETTAKESASAAAGQHISVLSRLVPHKQIEDALQVVASLISLQSDIHLDIIGDGWWRAQLVTRAKELGISDAVTFHGHVSEEVKNLLLSRSAVHLMPSRKEGWGLAVIEAALVGVPTIGYVHSRGLTDSIDSGVTGLLVDDLAQMVTATEQLLNNETYRLQLGVAARRQAEQYSWDSTATAMLSVLRAAQAGESISGVLTSAHTSRENVGDNGKEQKTNEQQPTIMN